jgi:hypothetical protein
MLTKTLQKQQNMKKLISEIAVIAKAHGLFTLLISIGLIITAPFAGLVSKLVLKLFLFTYNLI